REQDQAAPAKPEARKRVAGRNRYRQAEHDGEHGDPDAGPKRPKRIAARTEHLSPEFEAEFLRDLVREIPFLGECPQEKVGERAENRERDETEHHGDAEQLRPASHRERRAVHARPPSAAAWRR